MSNIPPEVHALAMRLRRLSLTSLMILQYALERDFISPYDVADRFKLTLDTARKKLQRLHSYGFLKRLDKGIYAPADPKLLALALVAALGTYKQENASKRRRRRKRGA